MLVGIDFDNTIVCYDRLFWELAVARELVLPSTVATKEAVRNSLRQVGREDDWTELQGLAYGPEILNAKPFPGAIEFFVWAKENDVSVSIISHKTRQPYRGPSFDLHASARLWLERHELVGAKGGVSPEQVFLEESKVGKLQRIGSLGCTQFIDDLPEFLAEREFPQHVEKILFAPNRTSGPTDPHDATVGPVWTVANSWNEIRAMIDSRRFPNESGV